MSSVLVLVIGNAILSLNLELPQNVIYSVPRLVRTTSVSYGYLRCEEQEELKITMNCLRSFHSHFYCTKPEEARKKHPCPCSNAACRYEKVLKYVRSVFRTCGPRNGPALPPYHRNARVPIVCVNQS